MKEVMDTIAYMGGFLVGVAMIVAIIFYAFVVLAAMWADRHNFEDIEQTEEQEEFWEYE